MPSKTLSESIINLEYLTILVWDEYLNTRVSRYSRVSGHILKNQTAPKIEKVGLISHWRLATNIRASGTFVKLPKCGTEGSAET